MEDEMKFRRIIDMEGLKKVLVPVKNN